MTSENHCLKEEMTFGDPFEDSGVEPDCRVALVLPVTRCRASPLLPKVNRGSTLALRSPHSQLFSRRAALFEKPERLVIYCQTTGVSAAHATYGATYCTPCRPLIRAFSGWIRTPPPTSRSQGNRMSPWHSLSTLNPQPSTLNPQPSTLNPKKNGRWPPQADARKP